MTSVKDTLTERQKTHGSFQSHADICQSLKAQMRRSSTWQDLPNHMKESLEMIQHKIARILNGSPNHHDHWHDIIGYATLVEDTLEK
jgi:hypothetical protein